MTDRDVRTWADGFGDWHASAIGTGPQTRKVCADAIHHELSIRSAGWVSSTRVQFVAATNGRSEWKERWRD